MENRESRRIEVLKPELPYFGETTLLEIGRTTEDITASAPLGKDPAPPYKTPHLSSNYQG